MTLAVAAYLTFCLCTCQTVFWSDEQQPRAVSSAERSAAVQRIGRPGELVGRWRAVLQVRRGSGSGAAVESVTGSWQFSDSSTALVLSFKPGSRLQQIRFTAAAKSATGLGVVLQEGGQEFSLVAVQPANAAVAVAERADWIFETADDAEKCRRLTVRRLSEIRWTVLLEERVAGGAEWRRMFEVGMTRDGERLGAAGVVGHPCVVTGGRGTIAVQHDGKTWYVCCEGCRQVFEEDPAGILKSYHARLEQEKQRERGEDGR